MCESPLMFVFKISRNRRKIKFRICRTPHATAARRGKVNPQTDEAKDRFTYRKRQTPRLTHIKIILPCRASEIRFRKNSCIVAPTKKITGARSAGSCRSAKHQLQSTGWSVERWVKLERWTGTQSAGDARTDPIYMYTYDLMGAPLV